MDAKQCPWCARWCLKDDACNYIFACGLETTGKFVIGSGCGRPWCFQCGKKLCGLYIDPVTGKKIGNRENHDTCCRSDEEFCEEAYCPGGHNSHTAKRW